jgi:hypothetical protein
MSSDYTSIFIDNDITMNQFVWRCARAMTQFAHMHRDENFLDSKLRMPILHSNLKSKIEQSEQDIKKYSCMTLKEATAICVAEHKEVQETYRKELDKSKNLRMKFSDMLQNIKDWEVPTDNYQSLKDFMIRELTNAISSQCTEDFCLAKINQPMPNPEIWLQNKIASMNRNLQFLRSEAEYEMQNHCKTVQWINGLRDSIPIAEPFQE